MECDKMAGKLTSEQAKRVRESIVPMLGYLHRLRARMDAVGFVPEDKLLRLAEAAENALHALVVELHYESCEHGVGRESDE